MSPIAWVVRPRVKKQTGISRVTMGEFSESKKEEIYRRIRSLVQTHLQAGISAGNLVLCHNCVYVKPLVGATRYGKYRLCNGCALKYELKKAEGRVKNIEDFVLD